MSAGGRQTESFVEVLIEGCENIPAESAPGDYVVVDVAHFSATVAELFTFGVEYIHVANERGDEPAYQKNHPDSLIGGGKTDDYEPSPGYNSFNPPSYIQQLDLDERPTATASTNGRHAASTFRERDGSDVGAFVGGYTDAVVVANLLEARGRPVTIVASGSNSQPMFDSILDTVFIDECLHGDGFIDHNRERYVRPLVAAKGPRYERKHEIRQRDLHEFGTVIDSRSIMPVLYNDRLVPTSWIDV